MGAEGSRPSRGGRYCAENPRLGKGQKKGVLTGSRRPCAAREIGLCGEHRGASPTRRETLAANDFESGAVRVVPRPGRLRASGQQPTCQRSNRYRRPSGRLTSVANCQPARASSRCRQFAPRAAWHCRSDARSKSRDQSNYQPASSNHWSRWAPSKGQSNCSAPSWVDVRCRESA